MNTPNIYQRCASDSGVVALLGSEPRIYLYGEAPDKPTAPYVVWSVFGGEPENYLSDAPTLDNYSLRFDVYAKSAKEARATTQAVRDCLQVADGNPGGGYVVGWSGEQRDAATRLYRFAFLMDFIENRT